MKKLERIEERIGVRVSKLNELLARTGEVVIHQTRVDAFRKRVEDIFFQKNHLEKQTVDMVKSLAINALRVSTDLHHLVMDIRQVEIKVMFYRFPKLVRDISLRIGKKVRLNIEGEDTMVDKTVIEDIYAPLMHIVRNAVDHGIESPAERISAGKPERGEIYLRAWRKGKNFFVEVKDDGRGLDIKRISKKAVSTGLITRAELDKKSRDEIFSFILEPGFSTASSVTDISGRGVGMDVVNDAVSRLNGNISIDSTPGTGSRFTMQIPVLSAVNIIEALIVKNGGHFFAVPLLCVYETVQIKKSELKTISGNPAFVHRDKTIILYSLDELLDRDTNPNPADAGPPCDETPGQDSDTTVVNMVIVRDKDETIGIIVDELLRPQKIVINLFDDFFDGVRGVSGTTILGSDRIGLILDVPVLVRMASSETGEDLLPEKGEGTGSVSLPADDLETSLLDNIEITEIIEEYIADMKKQIEALRESIVKMESDVENVDTLNTIFRAFHTIKGSSAMMEFQDVADLAHENEDFLSNVRNGLIILDSPGLDIIYMSLEEIEMFIHHLSGGKRKVIDATEILKKLSGYRIDRIQKVEEPEGDVSTQTFILSSFEELYYMRAREKEMNVYEIMFEFEPDNPMLFPFVFMILKELIASGDIIALLPSIQTIQAGNFKDVVRVVYATHSEEDKVSLHIEKEFMGFGLERFTLLPFKYEI